MSTEWEAFSNCVCPLLAHTTLPSKERSDGGPEFTVKDSMGLFVIKQQNAVELGLFALVGPVTVYKHVFASWG